MDDHNSSQLDEYLSTIVDRLKSLSFKEALSYAIFNEEDEAKYYAELAQKAKRPSVRALFLQMSDESLEHRDRLYRLFKKVFPNEEPVKVDAPPVEVAPFYPEFEKVEDYLHALEYCMESELFAKRTYEILSTKAEDEEARALFAQLALMEDEHYERIKKVYELISQMKKRRIALENIEPEGYLFEDRVKARYTFLDVAEGEKGMVITREHPKKIRSWMKSDVPVLWLSESAMRMEGVKTLPPRLLLDKAEDIAECISSENLKAILLESAEYLLLEAPEKDLIKFLLDLRDLAIERGFYLIVSAEREAFTPTGWAILRANMARVE
ncbi:ferritin family protein [Thermococcus sp. AM4]|uniref:ferritin family protein n=1 Tax=Thermococcus sp. (strain AM4) TaxID=246969 RepID=UPI00018709A8|nr:ferritin family protein [Thermococcus sp. AM4]EEB73257.1 Rubrerythrin [Thermococcus sp. AM4]